MGYTNFLIWAGKQGFKYGQRYLNKAWQEATKGGKQVLESQFPKLINKAKDYYKNFKGFDPKVVSKTDQLRRQTAIRDLMKDKPRGYKLSEEQIRQYMIGRRTALKYDRETALQSSPWDKNLWGPTRVTRSSQPIGPGKVIPFPKKPPGKAEGGIITVSDPGMGDGPFMMEEFLEAVKKGFKGTYDDYIDRIDRSPRDYLAEGGSTQKDIDKGLKAIEKLKSSLMPESYEELIEIYKDKQKDLNIDIMESAGGLGEMLGEGGRIGMMYGGDPGFAFSYGGSWADWKENHASEMPVMDYINQKLPKARNPFSDSSYQDGGPVIDKDKYNKALQAGKSPAEAYKEAIKDPLEALDLKAQFDEIFKKAEGGRIGLGSGTSPKIIENRKRNLYFDLGRDNFMNMFEYLQSGLSQNDYDGKYKKGGRVGFQEGTGIMSQTGIPYYADKAVEGIVNSAETLSKLPFAAGKLGSQLLQSPPDKKMFTDALENITPGSWSKNLGISSLAEAEGAKVSDKQRAIGDVLGLGTEIAVPVGGAFKIGQKIIDQASKAMGKLKKGKTLDQTINDKITNFGQSRRDFNATVAASGLLVALKGIGLGSLLKGATKVKPSDDVVMRLKTTIDDSDVMGDIGPEATAKWAGAFDIESLSKAARKTMEKLMIPGTKGTPRDRIGWSQYRTGHNEGIFSDIPTDEALDVLDTLKKAGHKVKFEHLDDTGGRGIEEALDEYKKLFGKNSDEYKKLLAKFKKMTEKEKVKYHSAITDDYNQSWDNSGSVDEILDLIYGKGKAEGGSVGYPPVQLNPKEQPPIQGPLYETNNPNEAFKEILRRNIGSGIAGAPIGGNFDLGVGYGENKPFDYGIGYNMGKGDSGLYADYGIRDEGENMYTGGYKGDNFDVGVRKEEGGDPTFGFKFKKKFAKGGKAWRPKSAPQLTTTIPPESGPMPQGLTYLTGDDIVQNIGHKHGRN